MFRIDAAPAAACIQEFCELWAEYDDGTSLIDPKALEAILMRLPPPMGLGRKAKPADVLSFVYQLDIPLVDGKVGSAAGVLCSSLGLELGGQGGMCTVPLKAGPQESRP